ncbi:MAG: hypothetical protein IT580_14875, partial [Verrucomicrobiales bacterium]|nr:hypothetical protein [Verrucomicrobiales bacterium]
GTAGSPFSLRSTAPQVVNSFLTLELGNARAFEAVIGGSGTNFIAPATVGPGRFLVPGRGAMGALLFAQRAPPGSEFLGAGASRTNPFWKIP